MNTIKTKEGWMVIEQDTHVGQWIQDTGKLAHDDFLIPIACDNMPVGGTVIDAGALYGDHSIAYAQKVGGEGTVICIESGALQYECLMENAKRFPSQIVLINAALCDEHGGTAIHSIQEGNIGMSNVTEDESKGMKIPTISIDGLVKDAALTRLDFIKIDCEGWEYDILNGAKGTLKSLKPILLIEINQYTLTEQGASDKDIYDLLLSLNYSWRIVQPDCTGSSPQFDIMCWPNKIDIKSHDIIQGSLG